MKASCSLLTDLQGSYKDSIAIARFLTHVAAQKWYNFSAASRSAAAFLGEEI